LPTLAALLAPRHGIVSTHEFECAFAVAHEQAVGVGNVRHLTVEGF
jgi:hypothetical protein